MNTSVLSPNYTSKFIDLKTINEDEEIIIFEKERRGRRHCQSDIIYIPSQSNEEPINDRPITPQRMPYSPPPMPISPENIRNRLESPKIRASMFNPTTVKAPSFSPRSTNNKIKKKLAPNSRTKYWQDWDE